MSVVLLSAFAVLPSITLKSGDNKVDISYLEAKHDDGKIIIYANYESYGNAFEIAKDITVSADSEFNDVLKLKLCTEEENNVYKYVFEAKDEISTVYIAPPILYVPELAERETVSLDKNELSLAAPSEDTWFSLTSVEMLASDSGVNSKNTQKDTATMVITIAGNSEKLPRFPKLSINGEIIEGTSALDFDENMNFTGGQFVFSSQMIHLSPVQAYQKTLALL